MSEIVVYPERSQQIEVKIKRIQAHVYFGEKVRSRKNLKKQ